MCSLLHVAPHPHPFTSTVRRPTSNQEIQFGLTDGGVLVEGLGVDSGGVLRPFLATNTCENTDRSVLGFATAFRETRLDAFVFMRGVCLSAAFPRSELLDFCRLPGATAGSLPASWRDGQPTRLLLAASAR